MKAKRLKINPIILICFILEDQFMEGEYLRFGSAIEVCNEYNCCGWWCNFLYCRLPTWLLFLLTFWNTPEILFYAQFHVYFLNLYAPHGCICLSTILTSELVSSEQLFCRALMGYWSFFICSKSVVINTHSGLLLL